MRLLLVDGNNIANRARHALKNLTTLDGRPSGAVFGFMQSLGYCKTKLGIETFNVIICWDFGRATWRKQLYPEYKQRERGKNFDDTEFKNFQTQMQALQANLPHLGCKQLRVDGVEADDLLSIYGRRLAADHDVFILSGDHDMHQLHDERLRIFDPVKDLLSDVDLTTEWFVPFAQIPLVKALMGDASDNIDGIPKIGKARAIDFVLQTKGNVYFTDDFKGKNRKTLDTIKTYESKQIIERNLKLMTLPRAWAEVPYEVAQSVEAERQFASQPIVDRRSFMQFLKDWELSSIEENISRW